MNFIPGDRMEAGSIDVDRVRAPLEELYARADAEVTASGSACLVSGRCCRFREFDHTLFLCAAEAALLVADAPAPVRPLDDGQTCPWQDQRGLCTARNARPLACRVFLCDPGYNQIGPQINERYLRELKQLTQTLDLPWNYAPLHTHLSMSACFASQPESTSQTSTSPEPNTP